MCFIPQRSKNSLCREYQPYKMAGRRNASLSGSPSVSSTGPPFKLLPLITDVIALYLRTQLGFILNLEQHWFTLRRFGKANPNIDLDEGDGHWFNLNSFLPAPEWVGKLYLGMVLQQAETEGTIHQSPQHYPCTNFL